MGETLVLARERRGCHMGDHEAGIHARIAHQEGRQSGQGRIDQQGNPPLRQRADFRNGEREDIGGEGDRLGVKISTRQHLPGIGKNQRIVRHRIRLDLEDGSSVPKLIETGAHHLRLAAQRIRVLHPLVVHQM